jgi:acyl-coenzyme A thioesterase PaaI-like protein
MQNKNARLTAALAVALAVATLEASPPAHAHHSFAAQYDASKPITLTGKVTKVEWTNPHVYVYVDVRDDKTGAVVNWALEIGGGPNSLIRQGWSRDSLKTDDVVTVEGSLARDGSRLASAQSIVLTATGKRVFAAPIPTETRDASR